jgi:hypothetical protein
LFFVAVPAPGGAPSHQGARRLAHFEDVMNDLTQIRFTAKVIIEEGRQRVGACLWVSQARAKSLIDANCAEYVGAGAQSASGKQTGPEQAKPIGPQETKAENKAKKPSGAGKGGQSTASLRSTPPGLAPQSSASPAAPVLAPNSSGLWPWPVSDAPGS